MARRLACERTADGSASSHRRGQRRLDLVCTRVRLTVAGPFQRRVAAERPGILLHPDISARGGTNGMQHPRRDSEALSGRAAAVSETFRRVLGKIKNFGDESDRTFHLNHHHPRLRTNFLSTRLK